MTQLFTVNHLIWLGISVGVIVCLLLLFFLTKWKTDTCMTIALVTLFVFEAVGISCNFAYVWGGISISWVELPVHFGLFFLVPLLVAKLSKKVSPARRVLFPVIAIMGTIGSLVEILLPAVDPTFVGGDYFTTAPVYVHFLYNAMAFAISVRIAADSEIEWNGMTYVRTLACSALLFLLSIYVNCILGTNLLYSRCPSNFISSIIVIKDQISCLIYLGEYLACALVLITLFMTPFMIARAVRIKKNKFSNKFTIELSDEEEADDETYSPATISSILASDEE